MPFKSTAQEGYMFVHHPEIAKRWAHKYGVPKDLPKHVGDKKKKKSEKKSSYDGEGAPMFVEKVVDTITAAGVAMEKMEQTLQKQAADKKAYDDLIPGVIDTLVRYGRIDDTTADKQAMAEWLSTPQGALDALSKLAGQIVETKSGSDLGAQQVDAKGRVISGHTKKAYDSTTSPFPGRPTAEKPESYKVFERGLGVGY